MPDPPPPFFKYPMKMKNNDFVEFNVHLIHRNQVPLFHNAVLILCDEGAGCVAVHHFAIKGFDLE